MNIYHDLVAVSSLRDNCKFEFSEQWHFNINAWNFYSNACFCFNLKKQQQYLSIESKIKTWFKLQNISFTSRLIEFCHNSFQSFSDLDSLWANGNDKRKINFEFKFGVKPWIVIQETYFFWTFDKSLSKAFSSWDSTSLTQFIYHAWNNFRLCNPIKLCEQKL